MKHLKENNTTYFKHFKRAMSMSLALFVHAFYPNAFPTYASDKMKQGSHTHNQPTHTDNK